MCACYLHTRMISYMHSVYTWHSQDAAANAPQFWRQSIHSHVTNTYIVTYIHTYMVLFAGRQQVRHSFGGISSVTGEALDASTETVMGYSVMAGKRHACIRVCMYVCMCMCRYGYCDGLQWHA